MPVADLNLDILDARPVTLRAWQGLELVLVGCGGTGSWLAPHLARLAWILQDAGKHVRCTFVDPDRVEPKNVPRQQFCHAEIGSYKAVALARRYGTAFGLDIAAVPAPFKPTGWRRSTDEVVVFVGCVDNAAARQALRAALEDVNATLSVKAPPGAWWLDCGNHTQAGQVLLGSATRATDLESAFTPPAFCRILPAPALLAPELLVPRAEEDPAAALSCAELALRNAQSLSINAAIAALAQDYLLRLLITGDLIRFASYVDLPAGTTRSRYTTPAAVAAAAGLPLGACDPPPAPPTKRPVRPVRTPLAAAAAL